MSGNGFRKRFGYALVLVFGIGIIGAALTEDLWAQQGWDRRTRVTFSGPVEVPGSVGAQILPAGTYVFRLYNSVANRHIVQIFSEDERMLYSTILAIPNYRRVATDQTVITFQERPAGLPPAVQAWFYPGNNWGHEFVYPRERATLLAQLADEPVLFIPDAVAAETAEIPPTPAVVALTEAPVRAIDPAGEIVPVATVVEEPPIQVASLPRTGSSLGLLALLGLLSVGAGLGLRRVVCD